MNKKQPPYSIPTMKDIAKIKPNGYMAISTFSGCGGSSLGYKMAGFRVAWASEFVPAAQETYRANHEGTILDTRDIRVVTPEEILTATGLKVGELDLLDGSPPCAAFSMAGKREAGWGVVKKYSDTRQRVDDLFFEFTRILNGLQPRVFVAENVSGLVKGTAKGYFLEILSALKACGYKVSCRVLDAQWLGVPQMRQRTIFIGVREDLGVEPRHPVPLPYRYSVRDALPWINSVSSLLPGKVRGKQSDKPSPTVTAHDTGGNGYHEVEAESSIAGYAIEEEWGKLGPGEASEKYFSLVKSDLDTPCQTVTALGGSNGGVACVTHPVEKRKFSIEELRRICSFPADFILTGTYSQQWERLGRAVPPIMMRAIATTVCEILDEAKKK